ncbi:MAG: putative peptidoglycan glycosyltransferase FtsW [Capsulimonadaceae bacterium]|nr:putative peptidoglycan glycosyltransferase FtsW [Capsulimonadaceae bacterium]
MTTRASTKSNTDFFLLTVVLLLTCIGILMVFDASYVHALQVHISPFKFVRQQALSAILGTAVMLVVMRIPVRKWETAALPLIMITVVGLIAVFIPHIGQEIKGARRWVLHVQPSELAKLAIVLYVARLCAGRPKIMKDFVGGPLIPLLVLAVLAFLIEREPDLGTCLVVVGAGLGALFFAGMRISHFFAVGAIACALILCVVMLKSGSHASPGYRGARLQVFLHPDRNHTDEGYQVYHSMIALGTGGIGGLGVGNGIQKYYLPEAHTDFIFATVAEEGGLIGSISVLALLCLLVTRGLHIATLTKDPFAAILAGGISAGFGVQALLNIGVVTSSVPATGVPLPFISFGGSSLFVSLVCVGILLSIYRYSDRDDGRAAREDAAPERDFDRRWNRGTTLSRPEYGQKP